MAKKVKKFELLLNEINNHKITYLLLTLILAACFILRIYRIDQLMGFYYDQGRDALVIWRLWHEGNFFLTGPVTGLAGIFLGPAFYYIISPFYLLGNGSPIYPSIFLSFTTTVAALVLYILGKKFHSREAGLFAATIFSFSYFLILASRWLSNPTMIILSSALFLWSLFEVSNGNKKIWPISALLLGLSLQFESASAVFYLPAYTVFIIWQKKNWPSFRLIILTLAAFFATFVPQVLFDLRNDGVIRGSILRELFVQQAFRPTFWQTISVRLPFYFEVFGSKILPYKYTFSIISFFIIVLTYLISRKNIFKNLGAKVTLLVFATPLIGYLLFQGNLGRVYDYYFTGFYLPFVLLLSIGMAELYRFKPARLLVLLFFIEFFLVNGNLIKQFQKEVTEPNHISLGNQIQSIQWVLEDSKGQKFNTDVYVPPVIPYSYDYLFLWQTNKKCGPNLCNMKLDEQVPLLYTLYEVDSPHPERLSAWFSRQHKIGIVEKEVSFGGITVQRRYRISGRGS